MNKGFIRLVYGEISGKLKSEIKNALENDIGKFGFQFVCYTFGENNHNFLKENGVRSIMMSKENLIYPYCQSLRHKLDCYSFASHDFDEFIYVDWDCNLRKNIPETIFDDMRGKAEMQACLYRWKRSVCPWREKREDQSYLSNNGLLYMRNKSLPQEAIDIYNDSKLNYKYMKGNDEVAISYLFDKISGGWKGEEYWEKNFEPDYVMHELTPVFPNKPSAIFWHDMK